MDNFCVKITEENKEAMQIWWKTKKFPGSRAWTTGAYYGIYKGKPYSSSYNNSTDLSTITFEELQEKTNPDYVVNNYPIY